jgi:hypothetical protein
LFGIVRSRARRELLAVGAVLDFYAVLQKQYLEAEAIPYGRNQVLL